MTIPKIQYGSNERTHLIDEHGSTVAQFMAFRDGTKSGPISNRLKIRHPADAVDIETLGKMCHDLLLDTTKIKPAIELDRSTVDGKVRYYIVESYTVIEY